MDARRLKALVVDDDEDDYLLTSALLAEMPNLKLNVEWARSYAHAVEAIARDEHDIYLLDYSLGQHTGLDLLHEMAAHTCRGPAIILTGCNERCVDLEAMNAGAADYLVKGKLDADQLERSIRYSVRQRRAEQQITRMAYYDGLTNLPNRVLFHDRLQQAVLHAARYHRRLAVMFLDIDNFKLLNDRLGHQAYLSKRFARPLYARMLTAQAQRLARRAGADPDAFVP